MPRTTAQYRLRTKVNAETEFTTSESKMLIEDLKIKEAMKQTMEETTDKVVTEPHKEIMRKTVNS